ncbi:PIG-L family deacetylase [Sphingobacterium paucimobilis]|nr:PIG-L family deacetylase [Sphingobacterium paucimobilis]
MFRKISLLFLFLISLHYAVRSQHGNMAASEIMIKLQKLNTLGSVLYFAAHPDDENTRLIAWLAQERKYRTGYLSLTRGDGGQNLIGTEQGIDLGLIRTQELLAARSIDKGEQFFSSAYDFGFSKTHQETFDFWDKKTALREAVWIIRKFRPDIIITRFPPDKRGGHGHHQASAILAHEAYLAAADPNQFPEQLATVSVWKAKRLLWNTANFGGMNNTSEDQLKIDIGAYSPLLGESYGEIAARSRSQHKSQGFGAATTRGTSIEYFDFVAGDKPQEDLMEGIETSWNRIPNTADIQVQINNIIKGFDYLNPEKSIPALFALREQVRTIGDPYWKTLKTQEIEDIITACAGIWVDATTVSSQYPMNKSFAVSLEAIARRPGIKVKLIKTSLGEVNQALATNNTWNSSSPYTWHHNTQSYWLEKAHSLGKFDVEPKDIGFPTNANRPIVEFTFDIDGKLLQRSQAIQYKVVDPVRGEIHSPVAITPVLTAEASSTIVLSTNGEEKNVDITFTRHNKDSNNFIVTIPQSDGWQVVPQQLNLDFGESNTITKQIRIKPSSANSDRSTINLIWNDQALKSIKTIDYDHIPRITWFPTTVINCERLDLVNPIKSIGYIAGAGDLVSKSLNEIGIATTNLNGHSLSAPLLRQYDAIVVGVRYFNINPQAATTQKLLMDYVAQGGVVLMQYNVNTKLMAEQLGPYPFAISRDRVTQEDAIVQFDAKDIAFSYPNMITAIDFEGWVQERGLYFADGIDRNYRTPLSIHDKDEQPNKGSLLITNYGKGKFVYTSLAFFRQLPAGVPGAYRLFVNLLSKEK